ncbi:MAG TPA: amylo-alpha-1,6-glucosidase [Gemmatimonadaceae bacterium]|nr:amylo-alpha-1,6-glucosidase [Gemmatimonadaceae bacterium]
MRRLLDRITRPLVVPRDEDDGAKTLCAAEWLVTNGLGGYSSGTVAGVNTRRYHGLLVAALPNPIGRLVMLNHLGERICVAGGEPTALNGEERVAGRLDREVAKRLSGFRLEAGLPIWEYELDGSRVEKRLYMPHKQNTVFVRYCLTKGDTPVKFELHPALHFRSYEAPVNIKIATRYSLSQSAGYYVFDAGDDSLPPLRVRVDGASASFVHEERLTSEFLYPVEEERGYEFRGTLWAPGRFEIELVPNVPVTLVASAETEEVMSALPPTAAFGWEEERRRRLLDSAIATHPQISDEVAAELVLAADQFIFTPAGRIVDSTRAAATGDEIRSVIAGYHWFTDWGRDTMISLEGLTLVTGRHREAGFILRTFEHYVRDGLIPNMFPDGSNEGLYHTADATLWFFHALHRYVHVTDDRRTLVRALPTLQSIIEHHLRGTKFGIHVDPADGLLVQGAASYQLTWMDAKVDDWVVTPRRGKAVEINALWYNALRLLAMWLEEERDHDGFTSRITDAAAQARESFNKRFWSDDLGYLYDVVDGENGDSRHCRPNQLFAISLDNPVLDRSRWEAVLDVVEKRLLTPLGLRSLAPGDPDYKSRYFGDLRARDAAYHQGTVWAWLIGPWVDAWIKVHPDDMTGARRFLSAFTDELGVYGLGTIGEIFDAQEPYTPRGCIAQAWSVAEVLRCWVKTASESTAGIPVTPALERETVGSSASD